MHAYADELLASSCRGLMLIQMTRVQYWVCDLLDQPAAMLSPGQIHLRQHTLPKHWAPAQVKGQGFGGTD